jgi:hypothetical protein
VGPPEELHCTPSHPDCPAGRALGSDDVDATGTVITQSVKLLSSLVCSQKWQSRCFSSIAKAEIHYQSFGCLQRLPERCS